MTLKNPYAELLAGRDPDAARPNETPYLPPSTGDAPDFTAQAGALARSNEPGILRQFGKDMFEEGIRNEPTFSTPSDLYAEMIIEQGGKLNTAPSPAEAAAAAAGREYPFKTPDAPRPPAESFGGKIGAAGQRGVGGMVEAVGKGMEFSGSAPVPPIERSEILDTPLRMGRARPNEMRDAMVRAGKSIAEYGERTAKSAPSPAVPRMTDIKSAADAGIYLAEKFTEGVASSAPIIAAGVVGGPGAILGISNFAGQGSVVKQFEEERETLMRTAVQAREMGLDIAAEKLARMAANLNPDAQRGLVAASGALMGMLDSVIPMALAGGLGRDQVREMIQRHAVASIAKHVAMGTVTEGMTEVTQDAIAILATARAKGYESAQDYADELYERRWDLAESLAGGAIPGAGGGAAIGGRGVAQARSEAAAKSRTLFGAGGGKKEENPYADPALQEQDVAALPPEQTPQPVAPESVPLPTESSPIPMESTTNPEIEQAVEIWKQAQATVAEPIAETATETETVAREQAAPPVIEAVDAIVAGLPAETQAQVAPIVEAVRETMPEATQAVGAQAAAIPQEITAQLEQLGIAQATTEQQVREIMAQRLDPAKRLQEYLASGGSLTGAPGAISQGAGIATSGGLATALRGGISQGALRQTLTGRIVPTQKVQPKTQAGIKATISDLARQMAPILPRGTTVKSFRDLADLPQTYRGSVVQGDGTVVSRATQQPVDAFADGDALFIAEYATNPAGRIAHEGVHALKNAGLISDKEIALLAERARKVGAFSKTREAGYVRDYKQRFPDWQTRLDEEAAAHLIEARVNGQDFGRQINGIIDRVLEFVRRLGNALRGMGFQTVDDVVNAVLSGEVARRQVVQQWMRENDVTALAVRPEAMMALADRDTGQSMRRDLDALGYYSQALEAARSLKQAKGTPEQMLAQLKSAGVKQAEIEATGLLSFLGLEQGSDGVVRRREGSDAPNRPQTGQMEGGRQGQTLGASQGQQGPAGRGSTESGRSSVSSSYSKYEADPASLIFRESEQNNIDGVRDYFAEGDGYYPAVVIKAQDGVSILDGHNRARVAADRGDKLPVVEISEAQYQAAKRVAGDDIDIAHAALEMAGEDDAASGLRAKFPGTSMLRDAPKIIEAMEDAASPAKSKPRLITRDEIVAHLEANRVGLREISTGRSAGEADVGRLTTERVVEWEEQELRKANFEYDRRFDDDAVYDKSDEWRAFAEQNGLLIDADRFDDDPVGALTDAGMKWSSGHIPLWRETNHWTFGETPSGKAAAYEVQNGFEVLQEPVGDYIKSFEVEARQYIQQNEIAADPADRRMGIRREVEDELNETDPTKWSSHSLDPSNPTYRETVLHLPSNDVTARVRLAQIVAEVKALEASGVDVPRDHPLKVEGRRLQAAAGDARKTDFSSGHFPEPNIVGHMMTSMTRHEGRPVYTIDQIQSDWGQKLRDGGVRDEAKIAELKAKMEAAKAASQAHMDTGPSILGGKIDTNNPTALSAMIMSIRQKASGTLERAGDPVAFEWRKRHEELQNGYNMALAELRTAEAATPGNPLVNTTDQWTTTTLRRAIRQAAEADAEYIAIPTGDTVLSYNPGDEGGMRGFYGSRTSEGIVPKNLRKLLEKLDKEAAKPTKIDELETPSGMKGKGFTLFPLTPKVKAEVMERGQAMFAFAGERAKTADLDALARAKEMDADGVDRTKIWTDTGWFRGVDGKWRFEIDDSGAFSRFDDNAKTFGGALDHEQLFRAYPDLASARFIPSYDNGGRYTPPGIVAREKIEAGTWDASSMLHEGQHAIQRREGFIAGSSPDNEAVEALYPGAIGKLRLARDLIRSRGDLQVGGEAATAARDRYIANAGEVESRAVEKRLGMSAEERRARPPWDDYDVPEDQQIVRMPNGGPMFAMGDDASPAEVKSLQSIVGDLARDLGLVMRQGLTKTAAGKAAARAGLSSVYDPQTGILRVTSVSDIKAVAGATAPVIRHKFGTKLDRLIVEKGRELTNTFGFIEPELSSRQQVLRDAVVAHIAHLRVQAEPGTNVLQNTREDALEADARFRQSRDEAAAAFTRLASEIGTDQAERLRTAILSRLDLTEQIGMKPVSIDAIAREVREAYDVNLRVKPPSPVDIAEAELGWRDFMQNFVSNPANAAAKYPRFTRAFESFLEAEDPILLAKLESAQEAIDAYYSADPTRFVDAIVHDPVKETRWEKFQEDKDRWGVKGALGMRLSSWYRATFDEQHPFYLATWELLNEASRTTGQRMDLPTALNPYKMLRMAPHTHAWATRDMENGIRDYTTNDHTGPGLIPALTTALGPSRRTARDTGPGSAYRAFSSYLVTRYAAIEWQRHMEGKKERPPTVMPPRSGSPASAIAYFNEARAKLDAEHPTFAAAADQIYDYQQQLLKLQRDAGLIKPETYDILIQDREYVPFYRQFDADENVPSKALGSGASGVLKRKRGSDRNVIDPIASIAQKTFETRSIIALNDVKRNLLKLAESAGPGGGVIAERIDRTRLKAIGIDVDKVIASAADDLDLDGSDLPAQMAMAHQVLGNDAVATYYTQKNIPSPGRPPIVFFFNNGEVEALQLGNGSRGHQLAAQMLDNLNTFGKMHNEAMSTLLMIGRAPAQLTRIGITTHPEFAAANIVRDALMAFQYDRRAIPMLTQIKGTIDVMRGAEYVQRFYANAGMMGGEATAALDKLRMNRDIRALVERGYKFRLFDSLPNAVDRLSDLFEARNWKDRAVGATVGAITGAAVGGPIGAGIGAVTGGMIGGSTIVKIGEVSETATRAQLFELAYQRGLKNGLDEAAAAQEAGFWAHEYTDYSRRGSKMEGLTAMIPFLNAALQGNDVYIRRLLGKGDQSWTPGLMYPLYRLGMLDINKLSPKEQEQLGDSAWTWAMTVFGLGSITVAVSMLWDDDERIKDIDDRVKAGHWLIPVGDEIYRIPKPFQTTWFSQIIERWITEGRHNNPRWFEHYMEDLWNTWKPPLIPSIAEVGATMAGVDLNRDGRQVIPDHIKRMNPDRTKQADAYTSEFAKWAGPKLDTAPMLVDHMITKFGATWGRTALSLNVPGTPWYNPQKPIRGPEEEFISRRFMWKAGRGSESGQALRQIMGAEEPLGILANRIAQPYSNLKKSADNYRDLIEKPIPDHAGAVDYLSTLTPYERGYALMEGTLRGPQDARLRLLHPMNRASKMASELIKMEKEIVGGELLSGRKGKDLKELPMSPEEKTLTRDILTQLRMMETHNALVITEETGWKGRVLFKTDDVMAELKIAAPKAHKELLGRFTKAGILSFDGVAKVWPGVRARLEDPRMMERARRNRMAGAGAQFYGLYERARATRPGSYQPQAEPAAAQP